MYISLNPLFVVLLSPIFIKIFSMLNHRNKEPSSIGKMTIGLFAIFISYLILLIPAYFSHGKINMLWIVLFNFTLVIAELFISPIALSLISKLAPVKHASLMIGTFYAATAVSALLAGVFASAFPEKPGVVNSLFGLIPIPNLASFIWIFVILSGLLLIIWTLSRNRIKKLMHGVE
jgi:POT family proton-dependent oligopeptide transporter